MTRLKKSEKVKHWSDSFGHSYSGADMLGGFPSQWFLVNVGEVRGGNNGLFVITLDVKRQDKMEGRQYIRSDNKDFLEQLRGELNNRIGISWEELGNLELSYF